MLCRFTSHIVTKKVCPNCGKHVSRKHRIQNGSKYNGRAKLYAILQRQVGQTCNKPGYILR